MAIFYTDSGSFNDLTVTGSNIVSGSLIITGSVNAPSITGSLLGTASYALTASFAMNGGGNGNLTTFTKGFTLINGTGLQSTDSGSFIIFNSQINCTASLVSAYRDSGSGAIINAYKNTTGSNLLATNLSTPTNMAWASSSTLQNQNFNIGDSLGITLVNFTGSVKEITVQVNFTT